MQLLIEAYNNTSYRVELPNEAITLRPGNHSSELDEFLKSRGWKSAVVITAFNPRSIVTSHEENVAANTALHAAASEAGYERYPATGIGDDPDWTPEDSVLLCGIGLTDALALAVQFEQNAIAYHEVNATTVIELTDICTVE